MLAIAGQLGHRVGNTVMCYTIDAFRIGPLKSLARKARRAIAPVDRTARLADFDARQADFQAG